MKKLVINILGIILLIFAGYAFFNQQIPIIDKLYPDIPSDNSKPGDSIKWTASAHDINGDPLVYRFSAVDSQGKIMGYSSWSSCNTWTWNTTSKDMGLFSIRVEIRDRHHAGPNGFDAYNVINYNVINKAPSISSVTITPESSQDAGEAVNIDVSATDRENDPITYEYKLLGPSTNSYWKSLEKSSSSSYSWSTGKEDIGQNYIIVSAIDTYHPEGTESNSKLIEIMDPKPTVGSPSPDIESPKIEGSVITWTAYATDRYDDPILYKFFLSGPSTGGSLKEMTDWSSNNKWTWTTSFDDIGESHIEVWVRDGKHASSDDYDDMGSAYFTIETPPPPPTNITTANESF